MTDRSLHPFAQRLARAARTVVLFALALASSACVYRLNIQQGNLLDEDKIDQVQVGMTRSQVQYLLGTPTINDTFHDQRWDYPYYLVRGRERNVVRRWVVVTFENDRVASIERDRELQPTS